MIIRLQDGMIELSGHCFAEEAEALLRYLQAAPTAIVDWRSCTYAHTAVIQVLLVAQPHLHGPPRDEALARHVAPLLNTSLP